MDHLYEMLKNPFSSILDEIINQKVVSIFPSAKEISNHQVGVLRDFLYSSPQKYYSIAAHNEYMNRFSEISRDDLLEYLDVNLNKLEKSISMMIEINAIDCHELRTAKNDHEESLWISQTILPEYLKIVEVVYCGFLHILAWKSRRDRNVSTEKLDVWNVVEELKDTLSSDIITVYDNTIRNGIAHGGVLFGNNEITFTDKKGNSKTVSVRSVFDLFDNMVDVCNGFFSAICILNLRKYATSLKSIKSLQFYELKMFSNSQWSKLLGMVESIATNNRKQLILYFKPESFSELTIRWAIIRTAIMAEMLLPEYDRYFISIVKSRYSNHGWAAFNGKLINEARRNNAISISDFKGIIEDDLIFFIPKLRLPKIFFKVYNFLHVLKLHFQYSAGKFGENGKIFCKFSKIHRNLWGLVLSGTIVIESDESDLREFIRHNSSHIVKLALKRAKRHCRNPILQILPVGFAQINVMRKDYRQRRLEGFGLSADLICTIRLHRIRRIKSPDIIGAEIENYGKFRIAWNQSWLSNL